MEKTITLTKKQFYDISAEEMAQVCAMFDELGRRKEALELAKLSAKLIKIIADELFK